MKRKYVNWSGVVLIVVGVVTAIYGLSHGGAGCTSNTDGGSACHGQSVVLGIAWGLSMSGIALLMVGFWLFSRQEARHYREKQGHHPHPG